MDVKKKEGAKASPPAPPVEAAKTTPATPPARKGHAPVIILPPGTPPDLE